MRKIIVLYGTAPSCIEEPFDPIFNKNYGTIVGVYSREEEAEEALAMMKETGEYKAFVHLCSYSFLKDSFSETWEAFARIQYIP